MTILKLHLIFEPTSKDPKFIFLDMTSIFDRSYIPIIGYRSAFKKGAREFVTALNQLAQENGIVVCCGGAGYDASSFKGIAKAFPEISKTKFVEFANIGLEPNVSGFMKRADAQQKIEKAMAVLPGMSYPAMTRVFADLYSDVTRRSIKAELAVLHGNTETRYVRFSSAVAVTDHPDVFASAQDRGFAGVLIGQDYYNHALRVIQHAFAKEETNDAATLDVKALRPVFS